MSYYLQSKSAYGTLSAFNADATLYLSAAATAQRAAVGSAVDDALRNVPLPAGLLTRLKLAADAMPDEAADQVDWLGC